VIRFECSCGKRLKVEDRFAGQTVECTDCHRRMRVPQAVAAAIPVAEVVAEPEAVATQADDPLAALAQAAKGNGGAKVGTKTPVRPGVVPRGTKLGARPGAKAPAGKTSATAELLAKRRMAAPNNKKAMFIAFGVAAVAIIGLVVFLALPSACPEQPTGNSGKTLYVIQEPAAKAEPRKHPAGEMFPSVAPQDADEPPAKPGEKK